ncbi:hypothetical protein GQ55_9G315300 [Panicum hallii var. hallii]|uniref:Uncharacterized protein n=1 Tax=Panicum hallii var. hallii TaxID=1504633 RepID=A0A2T7C814_9POAL|nr:hypothetical protein GQ55_9G315300 [Panicum hallii var. hallii]
MSALPPPCLLMQASSDSKWHRFQELVSRALPYLITMGYSVKSLASMHHRSPRCSKLKQCSELKQAPITWYIWSSSGVM